MLRISIVHGSQLDWKHGRAFSSRGILPKMLEKSEKDLLEN